MLNLKGATHIIKLIPNNAMIGNSITNIDHLFQLSNLTGTKFSSVKSAITSNTSIAVTDSLGVEVGRYIENVSSDRSTGNIWFRGDVEADKVYYLQIGKSLNKTNDSTIFTDMISSNGFDITSSTDRLGLKTYTPSYITQVADCVIGGGAGFLNDLSKLNITPSFTEAFNVQKLSLSLLIKETATQAYNVFLQFTTSNMVTYGFYLDSYDGLSTVTLFGLATVSATFMLSDYIDLNVPFLLTISFDGTQTDIDPDLQNAKRFKVFINGVDIPLTFSGAIPTSTWNGPSDAVCYIGVGGYSFKGVLDEFRVYTNATSTEKELWRYNNWMNQSTYWTPKVQPVVTSVQCFGVGCYEIRGSGFKPEALDPVISGGSVRIISASDTSVIVQSDSSASLWTITNSDDCSYTFTVPLELDGIVNVSQFTDAGYDVSFKKDGYNTNAGRILLNNTGTVSFAGIGYDTGKAMSLTSGRFHRIGGIGTVFSSDTTPNIGIHVTL